jgi:hypothetical protein
MVGNTWKSLTAALDLLEPIGVTTTFRYHAIGEGERGRRKRREREGEGEGETFLHLPCDLLHCTALHCTAALTG